MRTHRPVIAALTFAISLLLHAGCRSSVPYVAVPEARFRSELTRDGRVKLPLDQEGRERLKAFLRAGGDNANVGVGAVELGIEDRYGALLARLSDPGALALEDVTERATYEEWFGATRLRQVVDAREDAPPAIDPVALTDGKYWWIFYARHRRLIELLVVRAIPEEAPR